MTSPFRSLVPTFAVLALASASFAAQPSDVSKPPASYKIQDVQMTLERTPCFGTCPEYTVTVSGDGKGSYNGRRFVKTQGEETFQLDPKAALNLYNEFVGIEFTSMHDSYNVRPMVSLAPDGTVRQGGIMISDVPGFVITLRIGSYVKSVSVTDSFGPKDLSELAGKIDQATDSKRWVEGK